MKCGGRAKFYTVCRRKWTGGIIASTCADDDDDVTLVVHHSEGKKKHSDSAARAVEHRLIIEVFAYIVSRSFTFLL